MLPLFKLLYFIKKTTDDEKNEVKLEIYFFYLDGFEIEKDLVLHYLVNGLFNIFPQFMSTENKHHTNGPAISAIANR